MSGERRATDLLLQPGEYFVGDACYRVHTLLGSCVSITLWHPARRIGAMSHFLLARRPPGQAASAPDALDARYGEEAMLLMLEQLAQLDVTPQQCQAKIFGGGNMFPGQAAGGNGLGVGRRNGEAARVLLQAHAVPIASESLFGAGHRQIIFEIENGNVWSRQVAAGNGAPA